MPGPGRPVEVAGSPQPRCVEQGLLAPGWPSASLNVSYLLQLGTSHLSCLCGCRLGKRVHCEPESVQTRGKWRMAFVGDPVTQNQTRGGLGKNTGVCVQLWGACE